MSGEGRCGSEKVVRKRFPGKVTFEQSPDGGGGTTMTLLARECSRHRKQQVEGSGGRNVPGVFQTIREVIRGEKCWGTNLKIPQAVVGSLVF